jgi:hypothetical protein
LAIAQKKKSQKKISQAGIQSRQSKNRHFQLIPELVVLKYADGNFLLVNSSDEKNFYRLEGGAICHAFEGISAEKSEVQILAGLIKRYGSEASTPLKKGFRNLVAQLKKNKLLTEVKTR